VRWPKRLLFSLLVACSVRASAAAQTAGESAPLDRYQPTPFSDRVFRLDGPRVLPFGQYRVGTDVDYAFRPLVLIDPTAAILPAGAGPNHNLIEHAIGGSLLASAGLGHGLEAGLWVPLTIYQTGQTVAGAVEPSVAGLGNPGVGLKARLLDTSGWGLGASLMLGVPIGVGTLTHDSSWTGEARLFATYRRGPVTVGARGGFLVRDHQTFYDVSLGNELTVAAGATWQVRPRTGVLAELAGVTAASRPFADAKQSPLEVLFGVRQRLGKMWFTLAGGPGLVNGFGSPVYRVVAGFTWANRPPDADGDGISDDDDRCPTVAEDRDGFEDTDGCPDLDNDKDRIPDATDKCPNEAEDRDGFEDADGCPDLDNDKDGIPDATDKCPDKPETINDFEDEDGCPDESPPAADKDKDGIPDDTDECPEEPEDKDGFEDADGCPDLDNDKDGIPDATDKCPLEPETINGIDDDDGCPDKGPSQVRLGRDEIETLQPVYFDTDRSRVRHAFYNTLGQIALLLKAHPEIGRCGIEGHTDDTGPPEWNQKLSMLRAAAVVEFVANKGVDPKRLVPIGHGEELPWASNETPEGRAKNRRVVFHIEGVNPDEQKKMEQRQERRKRIRRRREAEQQKQEQHEKEQRRPAGDDEGGQGVSKPGAAPVKEGAPTAASTKASSSPAPSVKPTATPFPPPAPVAPPSKSGSAPFYGPEPAPSDKKVRPKPPAPAPALDSPGSVSASPVKSTPPVTVAPGPDRETKPESDKAPARPAPPKPPTRAPRRPSPDAGSGTPPTLKDLLKLPPR
jgi:outer membrane protein OmpA-like peptidoglycan-associated protein